MMRNVWIVRCLMVCMVTTSLLYAADQKITVDEPIKSQPFWPVFGKVLIGTAALTALSYAISQRETIDNVAGDQTTQFVRNTLAQAGYTQEQINAIKVLSGRVFFSTKDCIHVPFNDEQLLRAQRYYSTGDDLEGKEIAAAYFRKLREMNLYEELTDNDLFNLLQFEGKVITADTIPFWQGAIVHEMGHVIHQHLRRMTIFLGTVGSLCAAYGVAKMHQSQRMQNLFTWLGRIECAYVLPTSIILGAVLVLSGRLWRPHEVQADEEIIKRVKDPKVLKTTAQMFDSLGKLHHMKNKWKRWLINVLYCLDPHPRGDERAEKLYQAYQQLEQEKVAEVT